MTHTLVWSSSFNVTRTGSINSLRLYKSDREQSSELRAYIYDWNNRTALASVVVNPQECQASGWMRVELRQAVSLSPNRTYVAAIERLSYYRKNKGYFQAYKRDGDLIVIGSVYGLNEKKMPDKWDKQGDCYWIDGKSQKCLCVYIHMGEGRVGSSGDNEGKHLALTLAVHSLFEGGAVITSRTCLSPAVEYTPLVPFSMPSTGSSSADGKLEESATPSAQTAQKADVPSFEAPNTMPGSANTITPLSQAVPLPVMLPPTTPAIPKPASPAQSPIPKAILSATQVTKTQS
jgi:hypothetical protein